MKALPRFLVTLLICTLAIQIVLSPREARAAEASPWELSWKDAQALEPAAREKLWEAYREFLRTAEEAKAYPLAQSTWNRLYALLLEDANAEGTGFDCFYGGWPSKLSGSLCNRPQRGNSDLYQQLLQMQSDQSPCKTDPDDHLLCNPMLFGNGVCVSIATSEERQYAFHNCQAELDRKIQAGVFPRTRATDALWSIASQKPELFTNLVDSVNDVCTSRQQKTKPMCARLQERLADIRGGAGAKPEAHSEAQGFTTEMVQAWGDNIKDVMKFYNQYCYAPDGSEYEAVPTEDGHGINCFNLKRQINQRLQTLVDLDKYLQSVKLPQVEGCPECRKAQETQEIVRTAAQVDDISCKLDPQSHGAGIGDQIKCNLGRSVAAATYFDWSKTRLQKFLKVDKSHCQGDSSCLEEFVTSYVSMIVGLKNAAMAMLSAASSAVRGAGSYIASWWRGADDHNNQSSDVQNLAGHANDQELKEAERDPEGFLGRIFNTVMDWVFKDILCMEWKGGGPNAARDNCAKGFDRNCLNTNEVINIGCRAVSLLGGGSAVAGFGLKGGMKLASLSTKLGPLMVAQVAKVSPRVATMLARSGNAAVRAGGVAATTGNVAGRGALAAGRFSGAVADGSIAAIKAALRKTLMLDTTVVQWMSRNSSAAFRAVANRRLIGSPLRGAVHVKNAVKFSARTAKNLPRDFLVLQAKAAQLGWNLGDKVWGRVKMEF